MKGFSVIEVIIAAAIFMIFAVATGTVVLQGFSGNRLGEEQTIANQYAAEGLEAARSIKNRSFANVVSPLSTGILQSGGIWTFSGGNNQFGPNNKYTRALTIADVLRDGSGNIALSGTPDPNTKKITSTVNWNFGPTRSESVVLSTYLTNFRKLMGGLLVYGDSVNTPTIPKYRTYDSTANTFSAQTNTLTGNTPRSFVLRTSPTKGEAIAAYVFTTGGSSTLQVMCFDGSTWINEWTASVGTATPTRKFDIAYETNSGDVMVLYSRGTINTNELAYRTKPGTTGCGTANWAATTNLDPATTFGAVLWVKMAWDRRPTSNLITAIWADANSDLSTMVWSGTAWGNEPPAVTENDLEVASSSQDVEDFDVEYESLSGDVMLVWGRQTTRNNINGVRYRVCTGGTSNCTWGLVSAPPTFTDDATNLDISANPDPNSNEIVFAAIGNQQSDLQVGYWCGTGWNNVGGANKDISSQIPSAGSKLVTTGWLISGTTTRAIVVYNDSGTTGVNYITFTSAASTPCTSAPTWSATNVFTPIPVFANPQKYYDIQMDPQNKDTLMLTLSDNASDLFTKRLTMTAAPAFNWTNSDGGAALTTNLPQAINDPFSFAFWRN